MKTFKEYLIEFDRGDVQLQQQHAGTLQQQSTPKQQDQDDTFAKTPVIKDIIQNNAGNFIVVKNEMGVLSVQPSGGGKVTVVPQQAKFTFSGKSKDGRNIFKVG